MSFKLADSLDNLLRAGIAHNERHCIAEGRYPTSCGVRSQRAVAFTVKCSANKRNIQADAAVCGFWPGEQSFGTCSVEAIPAASSVMRLRIAQPVSLSSRPRRLQLLLSLFCC